MTEHFRRTYTELAEEAGSYADPDRAIARARRRQRGGLLVLSAVTAVALVAGAFLATRPDSPSPVPLPGATTSAPSPAVQPLPATAVGRATLAYAPCRDCQARIMTETGAHYLVPASDADVATAVQTSLSPDGRWVAFPVGRGIRVRDLTGDRVWTIAEPGPKDPRVWAEAWATDSSRLLLKEKRDGPDSTYATLRLDTGARTPTPVPAGSVVVGLLPTGAPLTVSNLLGPDRERSSRVTVTVGAGTTARETVIDATGWVEPSETLLWPAVYPAADGGYSLVVGTFPGESPKPTAVLRANRAGQVTDRQDNTARSYGFWSVLGSDGSNIMVAVQGTMAGQQERTVFTVAPDGRLREIIQLPLGSIVSSPGSPGGR